MFGEAFYEKDAPAFAPPWIETFAVPRREGGPAIRYIIISELAALLWLANASCLELHPFLHQAPLIDRPTCVVFDLDPGEGVTILQSAEVAFLLRELLQRLELRSFAKVSGSKGIQVYVPLNLPTSYDVTQPFARAVAELLERRHPDLVVAGMPIDLRLGKVFVDWSQNADHKTTIGVYSLRAKQERPHVSLPVTWKELRKACQRKDAAALVFEPAGALSRVRKVGDLFLPLLRLQQALPGEFSSSPRLTRKRRKSLADYEAKRDFTKTAEPRTQTLPRSRQGSRRRFVVQEHAASRLHYDFRLEMHEVLKSWAVPKGLPLRKGERRTAIETEDHPIDYLEFEGVIPAGDYGGGAVMVWDIGNYDVVDGSYWKGRFSVFLSGRKLKGQWSFERGESEDDRVKWSLVKESRAAKPITGKRLRTSALTGRTIEEIASPKPASLPWPKFVKPMKATAVTELPQGDRWIYEVKWDGYRAIALKKESDARLFSFKGKDLSSDFPGVAKAIGAIPAATAVLDGEIVAVDPQGKPSFQALQNRRNTGFQIVYYAFDLLEFNGENWMLRTLDQRKARLRILLQGSNVRYNAELTGSPAEIVRTVRAASLEGIVAKERDSSYRPGARGVCWLKLKLNKAQEFVIGGFKPNAGSFQSILVGYYDRCKLLFAGKVRQGFTPALRSSLLKSMRPFITRECPFANIPTSRKSHFGEGITGEEMAKLRWLRPELVARIGFTEWTHYDLLRHATFEGLLDDKNAREVVRETVPAA